MDHPNKKAKLLQTILILSHQENKEGTLLRENAKVESSFVNNVSVPNEVAVIALQTENDFTKIKVMGENGREGWVRTLYLCPPKFTIVTYNILTGPSSKHNTAQTPYESETTQEKFSAWVNRKEKVLRAVCNHDIVMLHETTRFQLDYLREKLGVQEYEFVEKIYDNDGSAILINNKVWVKQDRLACAIRPGYNQVVLAVKLQHIQTKKDVFVVSLHLKSGYKDTERRRCVEFETAMQHVYEKWPDARFAHLVVAGDLNSDYSAKYAELVRSMCPSHKLLNAAGQINGIGVNTPTYNFWQQSAFDYILFRENLFNLTHMYTEAAGDKAPNALQGSDHFPVSATLQLL
jgi:endonuclease/exonuclease/phosphatase family metal-dependent hydrolase